MLSPDGNRAYVIAYLQGVFFENADNSPPSALPRVYVFDTSKRGITSADLPVLGYFDIAGYPTCRSTAYECVRRSQGVVSPDGKTLFLSGSKNMVIAPIPGTLLPITN